MERYLGYGLYCDIIDSPDDGGWYAAIYGKDGRDVHVTEVHPTAADALAAAVDWARDERERGAQ